MRSWRVGICALLLFGSVVGCGTLSPGSSGQLTASGKPSAQEPMTRDDDTFRGRLETTTRQMTTAVSQPFDPTYWQQKQAERQARKKQQERLAAQANKNKKPSALSKWLFPEPRRPQTISEWLAQDRPIGDTK